MLLDRYDISESAEIVLPSDRRRAAALVELREAVPAGVNRRVAPRTPPIPGSTRPRLTWWSPSTHFAAMMRACRDLANQLDLDLAVWGHISDGNVHPNVLPRNYDDVERGRELILELARQVIAMGGSPLAEHGVGRNPVKQRLLEMLYGPSRYR